MIRLFLAALSMSCIGYGVNQSEAEEYKPLSRDSKIIGTYHIGLGAARPKFDDGLRFYNRLYGNEKAYPVMRVERLFFNWYAAIGVGGSLGYYKASGKAADIGDSSPLPSSEGALALDEESDLELTLLPIQVYITAQMTPFRGRWMILHGWFGTEAMYVQETRMTGSSDSAEDNTYVNSATNYGLVYGAAASFRLDPLDEESVSTLDVIGIRSVYLSPFFEVVRTTKKNIASFGRTSVGLAFNFESMY